MCPIAMNHARSSLPGDVPRVMSHDHERRGKSGCEPSNLGIFPKLFRNFRPNHLRNDFALWFRKNFVALRFRHEKSRLETSWDHAILLRQLGARSFAHLEFSLGPHTPCWQSPKSQVFLGERLSTVSKASRPSKRNAWVSSLPKTNISRLTSPY